ncbi:MAG: hypothetical protein Q8M11_14020 [Sulfuritalea sp.]|nr:hypothetical protein [Sulfuritalea sp.]MDP1982911.1 hypothetical protein [Sulfuritalea sp.]
MKARGESLHLPQVEGALAGEHGGHHALRTELGKIGLPETVLLHREFQYRGRRRCVASCGTFHSVEGDVCVPAHRPIKPVYVRQFVALADKAKELQS